MPQNQVMCVSSSVVSCCALASDAAIGCVIVTNCFVGGAVNVAVIIVVVVSNVVVNVFAASFEAGFLVSTLRQLLVSEISAGRTNIIVVDVSS